MSGYVDPYLYPGSNVLRNRFDIRDNAILDRVERRFVQQRITEGAPAGRFDLNHLRAIHHHLFQDVYDWAGQLRTVELAKSQTQFIPFRRIEMGVTSVNVVEFVCRLRWPRVMRLRWQSGVETPRSSPV